VCQRGTLVRDQESGEPLRLIAIVQDITNQKRAEEEIQNKEAHLSMTQRIARVGSWEMGLQQSLNSLSGALRLSDESYRILGYEPGGMVPDVDELSLHIHPEDRKRVNAVISEAMAASSPFEVECRVINRQGNLLHIVGRGEIIINGLRNRPVKVIGILQDITEQKRASLSLEEAKANFKNVLENTDTAFVLLDAERRIILFNRQADELMRRETDHPIKVGTRYEDLVRTNRREVVQQALATVVHKKQKLTYESHYVEDNRPETWYYVSIHPIFNEAEGLIGMSVATREITKEKNHLEQIKLSNDRYELVTRATKDVIWDWDLMDDMLYRSSSYGEVFGETVVPDDGMKDGWIERVHEEDQARVYQHMMSCIEDPRAEVWEDEYRFFRLNGELTYVRDRGLIIRNNNGQAIRMVGANR
jgi:PAS domain-containing protein